MTVKTIVDPGTNQSVDVYSWPIAPRDILRKLRKKEIKGARDLSWELFNDEESHWALEEDMEAPGDSSETSFSLNIVENGLDWTLGLAVLQFIQAFVAEKKLPLPFEVACSCSGSGDVFIVTKSGKVLKM
jgi:hypothetical protein